MGKRKTPPELQALLNAKVPVYSISRINTFNECPYSYYLSYIKKQKGINNVYAVLGGKMHDVLENIVLDKATEADLLPELNTALEDLEIANLHFPKDKKGGNNIRDKWIRDMTHFANTFVRPKGKLLVEIFILYMIYDTRYMQGYIDLIKHNKDGTVSLFDWKSSSLFSGSKIKEAGRQLAFYAMAMEALGYKVRDVAWIMLKYVDCVFEGRSKSKKKITKTLSRGRMIDEIRPYLEKDLDDLDIDDLDKDFMLYAAREANSLDSLPEEVKSKYKITPCVKYYELNDDIKAETLEYINKTIDIIESKDPKDKGEWPAKAEHSDDLFFCLNLCDYRNQCVYLKRRKEFANREKNLGW